MRDLDIQGIGMTSQRTRDRLIKRLQEKDISNEEVLRIISKVPRHLFIDEALASRSYEDTALPIGHGQTISQPFIVARMTEIITQQDKLDKVLEVGTGCGYQAAVLAPFVTELHTIEIIEPLYRNTQQLLHDLGYRNIRAHLGDGSWGWPRSAPYDAIIVTAAPEELPSALIEQLHIGGRMVIPIGSQHQTQALHVITRTSKTTYNTDIVEEVAFVPLVSSKK